MKELKKGYRLYQLLQRKEEDEDTKKAPEMENYQTGGGKGEGGGMAAAVKTGQAIDDEVEILLFQEHRLEYFI